MLLIMIIFGLISVALYYYKTNPHLAHTVSAKLIEWKNKICSKLLKWLGD